MQINIGRNGQQLGSFSEEEVREGLGRGTFLPTDLGWHEGLAEWQPLGSLAIFAGAMVPTATPVSGYPQPMMHPMIAAPRNSGLALASMICGIVSLVGMCCYLGVPCGIAAVICGHMANAEIKRAAGVVEGKGMATAGLITGYIAIGVSALMIIAIIVSAVSDSTMKH